MTVLSGSAEACYEAVQVRLTERGMAIPPLREVLNDPESDISGELLVVLVGDLCMAKQRQRVEDAATLECLLEAVSRARGLGTLLFTRCGSGIRIGNQDNWAEVDSHCLNKFCRDEVVWVIDAAVRAHGEHISRRVCQVPSGVSRLVFFNSTRARWQELRAA